MTYQGSLREDLPPITTFLNRLLALPIALQNLLFEAFEGLLEARVEAAIVAGDYEIGVETITAHSLQAGARRPLFTHAATGAETTLLEMVRRDRNRPLTLADALQCLHGEHHARMLVNARSGRAAVQVPAPSLTLDDGEVERRIRLVHPMKRQSVPVAALEESHWEEVGPDRFAEAWQTEVDQVPEFSESRFHIVTGLLLPIWDRLPRDTVRVYRMQTDDGARIIGRLLPPAMLDVVLLNFGIASAAPAVDGTNPLAITPDEAWKTVIDEGKNLSLVGELLIRRATVMGAARVELVGFTEGAVGRLKAMGLVSEIISWKLRLFIPTDERGPKILAALVEHRPIVRVWARAAAT